jgi:endonuclease/exonuclease/phosphatase family metal-dependent hydrolase
MKFVSKIVTLNILLLLSACASAPQSLSQIDIMTFNVRCGFCEKPDNINHWGKRIALVEKTIQTHNSDIIAIQEAEEFQTQDIAKMGRKYSYYGIGREEGEKGERNAILWDEAKYNAIATKTIWLNPTLAKYEKGWDASYRRTLSMVHLVEKKTNKEFWVFNAHLDNDGQKARSESIILIKNEIAKIGNMPVFLLGDFNDIPTSPAILEISKSMKNIVNYQKDDYSFHAFGKEAKTGFVIDYIFTNQQNPQINGTIIKDIYDGNYPSDHFPIIAKVKL